MPITLNRRHIIAGLPALVAGLRATPAGAEPPPEVTSVRLPVFVNVSDCQAPLYIAEALLRGEGITDVQWVGVKFGEGMADFEPVGAEDGPDSSDWINHDLIDFDWNFPPAHLRLIANGAPVKVLAGMHVGCLELFANEGVRSIADLKGKRVGVDIQLGIPHLMLIVIVASVGLDPARDIEWYTAPDFNPVELFAAGKIDAFLGGPPLPQEMRTRKLGHVILNTVNDKPWSQYYCCMMSARSEFIEKNPVATKRILRAVMKSVDFCVSEPEQAARGVVEKGFANNYDYALQAMREGRYNTWRDYDPADSLRFWGLRLQETGIIDVNPNDLIARGTDWRFLDELKRELKT
jgi:NitT/TauT family transport system substrate-binding protein